MQNFKHSKDHKKVDKRNRQLKRSSIISVALLLVILIVLNLIFTRFLGPHTRFDWTANQAMTLSDVSRELVNELESPARIVVLMEESAFPGAQYAQVDFVEGLIKEYDEVAGDAIEVDFIDPELTPSIIETLDPQGQHEGQVVRGRIAIHGTETGKLKILSARDFVNTQMNQQYQQVITGYSAEAAISGAINYVSSLETPIVYLSQGHGEGTLEKGYSFLNELMLNNNFTVEQLDSLSLTEIPEDARFIFMINPQQDLTEDEAAVYINYVKSGGNLLVLSEYGQRDLPNLNSVLFEFNLKLTNDRVVESDPGRQMGEDQYNFLAETPNSSLGQFGDQAWSIVGSSRAVEDAGNAKEWIETEAILTTGEQGAVEFGGETDDLSSSGRQVLGMLSENRGFVDGTTVTSTSKAIVLGSSMAFHDGIFSTFLRQSANYPLAVSTFNYLGEVDSDRLVIRPTPVVSYALGTQFQGSLNIASLFSWLILPLLFVIIAIVVYRRRKNL